MTNPPIPVLDIDRYLEVNDRFNDPFTFMLTKRGFFSEVTNLLNAMAFGLIVRRRFAVVQEKSHGINWSDFFDADLPEQKGLADVPVDPEWAITGVWSKHFHTIRSEISQMWGRREKLDIPSLGLRDLNIFQLRRILAYAFCGERQLRILDRRVGLPRIFTGPTAEQWRAVGLQPKDFGAIHVRRGDKIEGERYIGPAGERVQGHPESELVPLSAYVDLIRQCAGQVSTIFVMTDDYGAVEELRDLATPFRIRTLCSKDALGYRNDQFYQMSLEERTQSLQRLLIEVRIASQSAVFLGPFRSNLSLFVTNVHWDPARCRSIDVQSEWIPG